MLPKGGTRIWGDKEGAIDDEGQEITFGTIVDFHDGHSNCNSTPPVCHNRNSEYEDLVSDCVRHKISDKKNYNIDEGLELLRTVFPKLMEKNENWVKKKKKFLFFFIFLFFYFYFFIFIFFYFLIF